MKKIRFYSLASALMLASAMGLGSCSSDSAEPGGTPGVAGETVKTLFAINVPYGKDDSSNARPQSRMGANETQANNKFTGLEKMRLLTLESEPGKTATTYTSNINIGDGDNAYAKDAWRSVYREVQIPIGTANFVLYGRAVKTADYAKYGDIRINADAFNNDAAGNLSDIYFKLRTISPDADFSSNTNSTAILNVLNALAKTNTTYNPSSQGVSTADEKPIKWSEVTEASPADYRSPAERKILAEKYQQLISLKAGSANSVKSFLNGLLDYFNETDIAEGSTLTQAIVDNASDAYNKLNRTNNFPEELGLPDGIAKLQWNNGEFAYITADNTTIGDGNKVDYTKITYPACLAYMVSSPAMISDTELTNVTGLPNYDTWVSNPEQAWSAISSFSQAAVKSSTKTVALRNALQYGVANMKLSIRASEETLKDNLHALDATRDDQEVTVPGGGFTVTGVLVGGQPDQVEWNYEAKAETGFNQTIYDTKMNTTTEDGEFKAKYSDGTPSEYNYTLVFDNKNNKQAKQDDVYVTVELINTAADFYGVDGLVPKNGKFYLVGKLSVDDATADSKKEGIDHIFVKDHTTTVNLAFKDLKHAYNCIPDLRTSKISLGLAVSLEWQAGLQFDITIGDK